LIEIAGSGSLVFLSGDESITTEFRVGITVSSHQIPVSVSPTTSFPDLSVNLTGAFNTIKCCMTGMLERGWGRIINISSITGTQGGMGQCSYATTKAGLIGLAKTAALEGARKGVTCNALVLGVFDAGGFLEVAPEFKERIIKRMPMRRMGDPQEVSNVLAFLASEESRFITGETIEVSGGANLFTF